MLHFSGEIFRGKRISTKNKNEKQAPPFFAPLFLFEEDVVIRHIVYLFFCTVSSFNIYFFIYILLTKEELSFCWISIQYAMLYKQKYTSSFVILLFCNFTGWDIQESSQEELLLKQKLYPTCIKPTVTWGDLSQKGVTYINKRN